MPNRQIKIALLITGLSFFIGCSILYNAICLDCGALYGRLNLEDLNKISTNYSNIKITLLGTKYSTWPDKNGVYFIENIKPGNYTIHFNFNDENLAQIKNFRIKKKSLSLIRNIAPIFREKVKEQTIWDWINVERYTEYKYPLKFGDIMVKLPLVNNERKMGWLNIEGQFGTMSDSTGIIFIKKLPAITYVKITVCIFNKPYERFTNNYLQVKIKPDKVLIMEPKNFIKNVTIEPILRGWEGISKYVNKEKK